jgi:hypothetical protein
MPASVRSGNYCHGSHPVAAISSDTTLEATLSITSAAVAEPGVIVVSARPALRVQRCKNLKVKRQTQRQATVVPAIIVISSQLTLTLIGQLLQSRTEDSDGAPDPLARAGKQMPSRACQTTRWQPDANLKSSQPCQ